MLRIIALIAGVLAAILASLILGLGYLDPKSITGMGEKQVQLLRFALILIGNLSLLAGGISLARPRLGGILLILSAILWVAASIFQGHTFDLVPVGPALLALIGGGLALTDSFRARPVRAGLDTREGAYRSPLPAADPFDVAPVSRNYRNQPTADEIDAVTGSSLGGMAERDLIPGRLSGGPEPRRRGRAREEAEPAFRDLPETEVEESGLSRFGRSAASILSFLLYGGLAAAGGLLLLNVSQGGSSQPTVARETPRVESSAKPSATAEATAPSAPSREVRDVGNPGSTVTVAELAPAAGAPATSEPPPAPPESSTQAAETISINPHMADGVVVMQAPQAATPAQAAPADNVAATNLVETSEPTASEEPAAEPEQSAGAETAPQPDNADSALVAPIPATMSPALAAARRNPQPAFTSDI